MKPALKPPEIRRLELIYDEPLSNLAFNFNLRQYIVASMNASLKDLRMRNRISQAEVGRCRSTLSNPYDETAWN